MIDCGKVTDRIWDVTVVGAGPAGALAARQLALAGSSVLLVDKAPIGRWKVCGCCLNNAALAALEFASLGGLVQELGAVPLSSLKLAAGKHRAEIPTTGVSISRQAFDSALIRAGIASGVSFLPEAHATLCPTESDLRVVRLMHNGQESFVRTKLVLAADGLGGNLLSRQASVSCVTENRSRLGAGAILSHHPAFIRPGVIYMACASGGYVGFVLLEDGRLNVAAAFDREALVAAGNPGLAAQKILAEVGWPVIDGLADGNWRGTAALTRKCARLSCERVLVLGDAAGYVEPFTGEGIAWSLASAIEVVPFALRAIEKWDASVGKDWTNLYWRTFRNRQRTCRIVSRVLRHPMLTRFAIRLLSGRPALSIPIVKRLNAPCLGRR